jgi:hypothetical protein
LGCAALDAGAVGDIRASKLWAVRVGGGMSPATRVDQVGDSPPESAVGPGVFKVSFYQIFIPNLRPTLGGGDVVVGP